MRKLYSEVRQYVEDCTECGNLSVSGTHCVNLYRKLDNLLIIPDDCPLPDAPTPEKMGSAKTQPPTCAAVNGEAPLPAGVGFNAGGGVSVVVDDYRMKGKK